MSSDAAFKLQFNEQSISELASYLASASERFDTDAFVASALEGLDALELKERVAHISAAMRGALPSDVPTALTCLVKGLPPALTDTEGVSGYFRLWPLCHFVEAYAVEYPEQALDAMHALTKRFSCEFAIRPFIARHPERVFARLEEWVTDPDVHVRRLVSEGTRPRLPWGQRLRALDEDPTPSLALLDTLRHDPELFVRRSVANHLGDVAKRHPELAVERCARWLAEDNNETTEWVVKHALRTLVKRGHAGALTLQGFAPPLLNVEHFALSRESIDAGESFELSLRVTSTSSAPQQLAIDYALHLLKKNGRHAPTVFKWSVVTLGPHQTLTLTKRHVMRVVTTRRFYAGEQRVAAQINGQTLTDEMPFALRC